MKNIVLIGMMGCGKSTVGALLAEQLGRELVDTDAFIEEREGRAISDLFAAHGEEHLNIIFLADFYRLADSVNFRVRFNSAHLEKFKARIFNLGNDLIVKSDFLDRAAAVNHKYPFTVVFKLSAEIFKLVCAKIDFCRNIVYKIRHIASAFLYF